MHLQIAREFVATLPESKKATLLNTLAEPMWWLSFFSTTRRMAVGNEWNSFRRKRLLHELYSALDSFGIPRRGPRSRTTFDLRTAPNPKLAADIKDERILREAIARAVGGLPLSELRALRLPVGDLLDALMKG